MIGLKTHLNSDRRLGVTLLVLWLLAESLPATAGGVVVLRGRRIAAYERATTGLLEVLGADTQVLDLEGKDGINDRLVAKIKSIDPQVLVPIGTRASTQLHERFPARSIVFTMVLSPDERGLDGAKVTGVRLDISASEQFSRFSKLLPSMKTLGVLYDPSRTHSLIVSAQEAARTQGLTLVAVEVKSSAEAVQAAELLFPKVDALWMIPDATVTTAQTFRILLELSLGSKKPLLAFSSAFVRGGALAAIAPDYRELGRATGRLVRSILEGESPGALPIQDPPSTLFINRRTATRLGITIDPKTVPGLSIIE